MCEARSAPNFAVIADDSFLFIVKQLRQELRDLNHWRVK
jgi:hypothetical protein